MERSDDEWAMGVSPAVVPLLEEVEGLPADASGALLFGTEDRPSGTVLVEDGAICWAMASGMSRRLTDLLREQSDLALSEQALERVYRSCSLRGRPLGEALVERRIVTPEGLRTALRRHTAESVAAIAAFSGERPRWVAHRNRKYDAQFTFAVAEVALAIGAAGSHLVVEAQAVLERFEGDPNVVVVFDRELCAGTPYPVAGRNVAGMASAGLVALGRWAREIVDLSRAASGGCTLAAGFIEDGRAAVAWPAGQLLVSAVCANALQLGRLLSRYGAGS